jgi:catechol-2,3-dioxygenase
MLGDSNVTSTIAVDDMVKARDFYEQILGLQPITTGDEETLYRAGQGKLLIYVSATAGTNKATYATWLVADVPKAAATLMEKGVTFEQYDDMPGVEHEGVVHTRGALEAAWFRDPAGNILCISNEKME